MMYPLPYLKFTRPMTGSLSRFLSRFGILTFPCHLGCGNMWRHEGVGAEERSVQLPDWQS
eukprot:scaffold662_cov364-Pavlova_lutheri.AAC.56